MPSCLLPCPLRVTRSLITFVCPWQTPVPRTHHTEPRSAFDIPLITRGGKAKTFTLWVGWGGVGGKQASILQEQHLQDELVSKKLPQPQMTELWMGETFDHPDILSHRICSLFSRDRRCTPPLEDRRFNEWKQFDLEALRSLWLTAPPVLTMGLIGTLSTVGKWLGASAGLTFCNPHTITVLTGDREHGEGAGSGKDYTLRCRLLWQVCVVNSENTDIDFCSQLKYWR